MNNFGLVCITLSSDVRFRTITRTRLRTLDTRTQVTTLRIVVADLELVVPGLRFAKPG